MILARPSQVEICGLETFPYGFKLKNLSKPVRLFEEVYCGKEICFHSCVSVLYTL